MGSDVSMPQARVHQRRDGRMKESLKFKEIWAGAGEVTDECVLCLHARCITTFQ